MVKSVRIVAILFLWRCRQVVQGFTTPNHRWVPSSQSRSVLMASRSVATFDKTDFALETGEWPYTEVDVARVDGSDDAYFYDAPRFVTHIDDKAIAALTAYYREEFTAAIMAKNDKIDVLDLCSSWISHLPEEEFIQYGKVVGVGMNEEELKANKQLTSYLVKDLNKEPVLSELEDNSFDVVCNVVSVDYLTKPREIFQEMHRILRPGGVALMSFSNRCFPTKAIAMWLQADDIGRMTIVASYFHYSAEWNEIEALDLKETPKAPKAPSIQELMKNPGAGMAWMTAASASMATGDPMFVVKGVK